MDLGLGEIVVILAIVLLLFGPSKLPQLGESLAKGIRGFKQGMEGDGASSQGSPAAGGSSAAAEAPVAAADPPAPTQALAAPPDPPTPTQARADGPERPGGDGGGTA